MSINKVLVMGAALSASSNLSDALSRAITYSPAKCDCINCRLGKHETCQTFSPSKEASGNEKLKN